MHIPGHNVTSNGKTTPRMSLLGVAKTLITAPMRQREANRDANLIQRARKYDGMPNFGKVSRLPTEGFKARSLANDARERTKARKPY